MINLYVIADEPFNLAHIKLTKGKKYEVISYLKSQGNKLFLVKDDKGNTCTYNIAHFTKAFISEEVI